MKIFPPFDDDYSIIPDSWPAAIPPPTAEGVSERVEREGLPHSSAPACSPEEERPSLSVTPSQANGMAHIHSAVYSLGPGGCMCREQGWRDGGKWLF